MCAIAICAPASSAAGPTGSGAGLVVPPRAESAAQRQIASVIGVNPHGEIWDIAAAPDGSLWYIDWEDPGDPSKWRYRIGRITRSGIKQEFGPDLIPRSYPDFGVRLTSLYVANDGTVWFGFAEAWGGGIARIASDGQVDIVHRVTPDSEPAPTGQPAMSITGMAMGPDGHIWSTDCSGGGERYRVGRMTTGGDMEWFQGPYRADTAAGYDPCLENIAAAHDGAYWFTDNSEDKVGRIGSSGGMRRVTVGGRHSYLTDLAVAADGKVWFTDSDFAAGVIDPVSLEVKRFSRGFTRHCTRCGPIAIAPGSDGAMWLALHRGVGRLDRRGVLTEYDLPGRRTYPEELSAGRDGTLWYVDGTRRRVGVVTPTTARAPRVDIIGRRVQLGKRRIDVKVLCGRGVGRCVGRLALHARGGSGRRVALGSAQISISAPRRVTVRVPLTLPGRRLVRGMSASRKSFVMASISSVRGGDRRRMSVAGWPQK